MKRLTEYLGVFLLGLVLTTAVARAAVSLPFSDGFEDQAIGAAPSNVWVIGAADIYVTNTSPAIGTQSLQMDEGDEDPELTLAVGGGESNVYWVGSAKVTKGSSDPSIGTSVAAFYITTNNVVRASDGGDWTNLYTLSKDAETNWISYAVHLDYTNGIGMWDLYLAETNSAAKLTKRNSAPLDFAAQGAGLVEFEVTGNTSLDAVAMNIGFTAVGVATSPDELSVRTASHNSNIWYSARVGDVGAAKFLEPDGDYLKEGLAVGDIIKFYDTDAWETYKIEELGGVRVWSAVNSAATPILSTTQKVAGAMPITNGIPYWIVYASTATDVPLFFPYDHDPAVIAEETLSMGSCTINSNGTAAGWTTLRWTSANTRSLTAAGLTDAGFDPDVPDGMVCISIESGTWKFVRSVWDNGQDRWEVRGGKVSTDVFQPDEEIWLYNPGDDDITWTIID